MLRGKKLFNIILVLIISYFFFLNCSFSETQECSAIVIRNVLITKDTELNITLPSGATNVCLVTGTVKNTFGKPQEGVSVLASPIDENWLFCLGGAETNSYGYFELALAKGTYNFGFGPVQKSRSLPKYLTNIAVYRNITINVTLKNGVFFAGDVLNEFNNPAFGSVVYAKNLSSQIFDDLDVDTNGKFKRSLPKGSYDVDVIRQIQMPEFLNWNRFPLFINKKIGKISLGKDTQLKIKMPLGGKIIKGSIKDKNGNIIIANVWFINHSELKEGKPWARGYNTLNTCLPDMNYKASLVKGTYTVQCIPFHVEGANIVNKRAIIKIKKDIQLTQNKNLNFVLDNGFILSGVIKNSAGEIVNDATLLITNMQKPDDGMDPNKYWAVTFAMYGKYYYPLPKGSYDIYVFAPTPTDTGAFGSIYPHLMNFLERKDQKSLLWPLFLINHRLFLLNPKLNHLF